MQENNEQTELVLLSSLVTVNCKHTFDDAELLQKSQQIANLITDINHEEDEKKAIGAQYKNKIDTMKAEAKLVSGHITNGFMYTDKPAELYLDYGTSQRVYVDKHNGEELRRDIFHASDFQKKIDFDLEETARQQQIEENNATGSYAEGSLAQGIYNPVDAIIIDKKLGKVKKEKPKPADNLSPNYGRDFEPGEE